MRGPLHFFFVCVFSSVIISCGGGSGGSNGGSESSTQVTDQPVSIKYSKSSYSSYSIIEVELDDTLDPSLFASLLLDDEDMTENVTWTSLNNLLFLLPSIDSGEHVITINFGNDEYQLVINVTNIVLGADPLVNINDYAVQLDTLLFDLESLNIGNLAIQQGIEVVRVNLSDGLTNIVNLNPQDLTKLANFINANIGSNANSYSNKTSSFYDSKQSAYNDDTYQQSINTSLCRNLGEQLVATSIGFNNAANMATVANAGLFESEIAQQIASGISSGVVLDKTNDVIENFVNIENECFDKDIDNVTVSQKVSPTGLDFDEDVSRSFSINSVYRLPEWMIDYINESYTGIGDLEIDPLTGDVVTSRTILNQILPADWVSKLAEYADKSLFNLSSSASTYSITNISNSESIYLSNSSFGESVTLQFSFNEQARPTEPMNFSFDLDDTRTPGTPTTYNATLTPLAVPEVYDFNMSVIENVEFNSETSREISRSLRNLNLQLWESNQSITYSVASYGSYGTFVINNPSTGTYTYTPYENISDVTDAVRYTATNEIGTSREATIGFMIRPDTENPVVEITSPSPAEIVTGNVTLSATATDNGRVANVEFIIGGVSIGTDTAEPYSMSYDTSRLISGQTYVLEVRATDQAGNTTSHIREFETSCENATPPNIISYTISCASGDRAWNIDIDFQDEAGILTSGSYYGSFSDNAYPVRLWFLNDQHASNGYDAMLLNGTKFAGTVRLTVGLPYDMYGNGGYVCTSSDSYTVELNWRNSWKAGLLNSCGLESETSTFDMTYWTFSR